MASKKPSKTGKKITHPTASHKLEKRSTPKKKESKKRVEEDVEDDLLGGENLRRGTRHFEHYGDFDESYRGLEDSVKEKKHPQNLGDVDEAFQKRGKKQAQGE